MLQYSYDVKINAGAHMLKHGNFATAFPQCGEILISSKKFNDLAQCKVALDGLLSSLSAHERQYSDTNLVIVTKTNPLHLQEASSYVEGENWEDITVMRAYIADAARLKKSELKFDMYAQIKTTDYISADKYQ